MKYIQDGIPAGNHTDKYNSRNPIHRYMVNNFLKKIKNIVTEVKDCVKSVKEIGCGEGYLSNFIAEMNFAPVRSCDCSEEIIEHAR